MFNLDITPLRFLVDDFHTQMKLFGFSGLKHQKYKEHKKPFFENVFDPKTGIGGRNITTAEGGTALLMCSIKHLGDNNTVSIDRPTQGTLVTLPPEGMK